MKRFAWTLVFVAALSGLAFASQEAAAAKAEPSLVVGLISAIIGGALAVFVGWGKNKDISSGAHEPFDFKHAWPTLIIGVAVGLAGYFLKMGPSDVVGMLESSPIYGVAIFGAEAVWKMIFRNSTALVKDALSAIKAGASNPPTPPSNPS